MSIQTFTTGLDVTAYQNNELVQAAVERKFEVIGEALNQLSKLDAAMAAQLPDLPQIVAFRNQLIHGYATVNPSTVWTIIQQSLPGLITVVQALLGDQP
ncbi:HepT-like ribonuclease domain-containing protein [Limnohabitans sp.]|uniref:HepT-like ribonuclease domain-containing protein n=2 Tax=unclassified Limnohabitans TaxID=2626134 RepID=UPI0031FD87FE